MKKLSTCFSPALLPLYTLKERVVVIVDILRASSCITTAFGHGVASIKPVTSLEACRDLQQQGYLAAAEREGKRVAGFDLDNSPFSYRNKALKGKKLAMSTTNGTRAINQSMAAKQVLVGSFLNLSCLADYCAAQSQDVLVVCAGWKEIFCLEDTLFAGALADKLQGTFILEDDASLAAQTCYQHALQDLLGYVLQSSHAKRLASLPMQEDISFCLQTDVYKVIPAMVGDALSNLMSPQS